MNNPGYFYFDTEKPGKPALKNAGGRHRGVNHQTPAARAFSPSRHPLRVRYGLLVGPVSFEEEPIEFFGSIDFVILPVGRATPTGLVSCL